MAETERGASVYNIYFGRNNMKNIFCFTGRWVALLLLASFVGTVFADTPRVSAEDDRRAKQAVPVRGKALIYIYRKQDDSASVTPVTLNGREVVRLEPQTFGLWNVEVGRNEIRAGGKTLALQCEPGRTYFVELTILTGGVALRQVSYAIGRTQTQQARLAGSPPRVAPKTKPAPTAPATAAVSTPVRRENFVLALKTGSFKLADESQTVISPQQFDSSASSLYAIEGEGFINDNLSVGGEYLHYSNAFTDVLSGVAGKMTTTVYLVNAKYYFGSSAWRPYVGGGLGAATSSFNGPLTGDLGGVAVQAFGGVQWRWQWIGVRAEYKFLKANTDGTNTAGGTEKMDASGSGFFLGASFHF